MLKLLVKVEKQSHDLEAKEGKSAVLCYELRQACSEDGGVGCSEIRINPYIYVDIPVIYRDRLALRDSNRKLHSLQLFLLAAFDKVVFEDTVLLLSYNCVLDSFREDGHYRNVCLCVKLESSMLILVVRIKVGVDSLDLNLKFCYDWDLFASDV